MSRETASKVPQADDAFGSAEATRGGCPDREFVRRSATVFELSIPCGDFSPPDKSALLFIGHFVVDRPWITLVHRRQLPSGLG